MAYRNKLYIAFDGDNDMNYYLTLKMWRANPGIDFEFHNAHDLGSSRDTSLSESIKASLRMRMQNSKAMLLLVGENTRFLRKFVPFEIQLARRLDIPIIVANLNGERIYDPSRCPAAVEDDTNTVHISFEQKIIRHALANYPDWYHSNKHSTKNHGLSYPASVYRDLGL
ncbi:TIR domain-containing protein [Amycolatopsis sp. NPDC051758]|uniref:TIR domain-containing protein n=1 Tax=Amycolatopsis sp. NPDC051758 TaxID=3363935 RepID=UPI00379DB6CA